jgi:2-polyprenyl-3-methyl-5-hydroxy-6-metoxy-1,4-benzoquinol methylase
MESKPAISSDTPDWDANSHYKDVRVALDYDAARFSSLPGRVFNNREKRIVLRAFAGVPRGGRIADVPCGTGRLAEPLLAAGYRVHGIDISQQMLDVASRRLARFSDAFTTEASDAKRLPTLGPRFEAVLCARVLMHFPLEEQIEFLKGAATLTSGVVVINHSLSSPYQRMRRRIKRLLGHQAPARYPVSEEQIARLLSSAGLEEVSRYRLGPMLSEAVYIVAKAIPGNLAQ